jgi:hypothetical protein
MSLTLQRSKLPMTCRGDRLSIRLRVVVPSTRAVHLSKKIQQQQQQQQQLLLLLLHELKTVVARSQNEYPSIKCRLESMKGWQEITPA